MPCGPRRAAVLGFGLLSAAAMAEEPRVFVNNGMYPNIGVDWDSFLQTDYSRLDSGPDRTTTDTYIDLNPIAHFRFSPQSEIWLDVELAPVNPPDQGDDRAFGDLGIVVNDLNFLHTADAYWYRIGKYEIPFGQAWYAAPGIYTGDFVGDYDFDGYLGGVFAYRFQAGRFGVIQPTVGTHFQDTTFLSRAYLQNDSQLKKSDGGPANTGSPESFFAVVDWSAIPALYNLQAQIGYIFNKQGEGDESNETGYAASAQYFVSPGSSNLLGPQLGSRYVDVGVFVEYVKFKNKDGVAGAKEAFLTTSLILDYGQWNFGLTRTSVDATGTNGGGPDDYLNEFSVQYNFTRLFAAQVGVGTTRQDGEKSGIVGITVDYSRPF